MRRFMAVLLVLAFMAPSVATASAPFTTAVQNFAVDRP